MVNGPLTIIQKAKAWEETPPIPTNLCSSQTQSFLQKQRIHWGTLIDQTPRTWSISLYLEQSTGIPHFIVLRFVKLYWCLHFLNIKVCGNPGLSDDELSFLSMKYFLIKVHSFFRHNTIALLIDYSVNITFICTENPKYLWLTLLWYLLYCTGLEPNPQDFRDMPTEWRESEWIEGPWEISSTGERCPRDSFWAAALAEVYSQGN